MKLSISVALAAGGWGERPALKDEIPTINRIETNGFIRHVGQTIYQICRLLEINCCSFLFNTGCSLLQFGVSDFAQQLLLSAVVLDSAAGEQGQQKNPALAGLFVMVAGFLS
jgi:hypothetical protein